MSQRNGGPRLSGLLLITGLVLVWELFTFGPSATPRIVPSPWAVIVSTYHMAAEGTLIKDFFWTLFRVASGFAIGAWLGTTVGKLTGSRPRLSDFLDPLLQVFRPIPAIALVPLAIVWFGVGELSKLSIIVWACFFPVWINTHAGVRRVPREIVWTARVLGASKARIDREVIARWAAPEMIDGVRIGLGLCFAAAVVAEMQGASVGLGYRIIEGHLAFRFDRMLAATIMVGLFGFAGDKLFRVFIHRRFPWFEFKDLGAS